MKDVLRRPVVPLEYTEENKKIALTNELLIDKNRFIFIKEADGEFRNLQEIILRYLGGVLVFRGFFDTYQDMVDNIDLYEWAVGDMWIVKEDETRLDPDDPDSADTIDNKNIEYIIAQKNYNKGDGIDDSDNERYWECLGNPFHRGIDSSYIYNNSDKFPTSNAVYDYTNRNFVHDVWWDEENDDLIFKIGVIDTEDYDDSNTYNTDGIQKIHTLTQTHTRVQRRPTVYSYKDNTKLIYLSGTIQNATNKDRQYFDPQVFIGTTPGELNVDSLRLHSLDLYYQDEDNTKRIKINPTAITVGSEVSTTLNGTLTVNKTVTLNDALSVAKAAVLSDTLTVNKATVLNDTLTVAANKKTTLGGELEVAGTTLLNDALSVAKAAVLSDTLEVSKATTLLDSLTVNKATVLNDTLTVANGKKTTLGGELEVAGTTLLNDSLTVAANKKTTLGGQLSVSKATTLLDTLEVSKAATLLNSLTVEKAATLNDTLTVTKATQLNDTLTVADNKKTTLGGELEVSGAVILSNSLTVDKATQLNDTLMIASGKKTTLGGELEVFESTVLNDTLSVTKATQLNDTLSVAKAVTLSDALTVTKATQLNDTLTVAKAAVLSDTLTVNKATQLNDTLTVAANKKTTLGGLLSVSKATTLLDTLEVSKATTLLDSLTVDKAVTLNDTLTVNEATILNHTLTVANGKTTNLGGLLNVAGATSLSGKLDVTGAIKTTNTNTPGLDLDIASIYTSGGIYATKNIRADGSIYTKVDNTLVDLGKYVSDGKTSVAGTIADKLGVNAATSTSNGKTYYTFESLNNAITAAMSSDQSYMGDAPRNMVHPSYTFTSNTAGRRAGGSMKVLPSPYKGSTIGVAIGPITDDNNLTLGEKYLYMTIANAGYHGDGTRVGRALDEFGDASTDNVLKDKTVTSTAGFCIAGTMPNRGSVSESLNCGESYTIPKGYHDGTGKVTANSLASQTDGNATANKILKGYTAYVDGEKVTGTIETMPSNFYADNIAFGSGTLKDANGNVVSTGRHLYMRITNSGYHDGPTHIARPASDFGDATQSHVLNGKKYTSEQGVGLTGVMPNNGSVSKALYCGESYTIPEGYHDGTGKITANSLASQTDGNATADKILKDYTAYVDGIKITGSMTNRGSVSKSLNCGKSYTIPEGYHDGTGVVTANSLASQTNGNATADKILKGSTAYVDGKKITGTLENVFQATPLFVTKVARWTGNKNILNSTSETISVNIGSTTSIGPNLDRFFLHIDAYIYNKNHVSTETGGADTAVGAARVGYYILNWNSDGPFTTGDDYSSLSITGRVYNTSQDNGATFKMRFSLTSSSDGFLLNITCHSVTLRSSGVTLDNLRLQLNFRAYLLDNADRLA